jgi:hypothetical protein
MARFGLVFCQLIVDDGWYCQTYGSVLDLALTAWIVKQDSTLFNCCHLLPIPYTSSKLDSRTDRMANVIVFAVFCDDHH